MIVVAAVFITTTSSPSDQDSHQLLLRAWPPAGPRARLHGRERDLRLAHGAQLDASCRLDGSSYPGAGQGAAGRCRCGGFLKNMLFSLSFKNN